jgi:carbon storage regulator
MLILTRRPHEAVMVGKDVKIMVLGFKGGQVRLGIDAPPDVEVDREEVRLRKKQETAGLVTHESHLSVVNVEAPAEYPRDERFQNPEMSSLPDRDVS